MTKPIRMRGTPASPGIAIARSRVIDRETIRIPRIRLEPSDVHVEQQRLKQSVDKARSQLNNAMKAILDAGGGHGDHSLIIQAHLLMLDDELLIQGASELIADKLINAEWALQLNMSEVSQMLANLGDDYLSERSKDVEFVGNRVLRNMLGHATEIIDNANPQDPCIVVSVNLSPAETAHMVSGAVLAFATEEGTRTSHTAIMAQALGIPAVVGVELLTDHLESGDIIIVDGLEGTVIIRPDDTLVAQYEEKKRHFIEIETRMLSTRDQPAITTDGTNIKLLSNIEFPAEAALALDFGADGIGLYRTEFLFLDRLVPPDEEEQYRTFQSVMRTNGKRPLVFRTFDLGADKMPYGFHSKEKNPALGLRAIRLGLRNRGMFKTHLKALLRTAADGDLQIMFPMISGISELRQIKALLAEARGEIDQELVGDIKIGCMIELPSAVFVADLLAREVDFFSIGTNDLIQYSLAIDRSNDHVSYLYTPYHPSVLKAVHMVIEAGQKVGIPVSMCGGAASEPAMAPIWVGMGLRIMSMAPSAIPFVKTAIRSFSLADAKDLALSVLNVATAVEVEDIAQKFIKQVTNQEF